jgi:hypothetical protein
VSKPKNLPEYPSFNTVFAEQVPQAAELVNPATPPERIEAIKADIQQSFDAVAKVAARNKQSARHGKVSGETYKPTTWADVFHGEAIRHHYGQLATSEDRRNFIAAWINDDRQRTKRRFAKDESQNYGIKFNTAYRALQGKDIRRPEK